MAEGIAQLPSNRAAIYARVSTEDKGQTPDNQLLQLRAWCERMGYPVAREYVEHENGGKGIEYRKQLAAMFVGAARREFDFLLVWSLDRFSREGMAATVAHLQRLGARPSNSQQAEVLEFYCQMAHQVGVIQQFCPVECIIL
jgi:DNA invertase Pin-like site-specific DNA recombinase